MSTDFVPTLVEDDRVILSSKLPFEVYQGASSVSPQVFAANTSTSSSHTYTVTVPSYESVTDMNIMIDTDIIYTITGVPPNLQYLVNYGNVASGNTVDCLAPFPFLQNVIVASATINQSQVSVNCQDVLPALLPCISRDSLSVYNSMTPTTLDNVQSYTANASYYNSQASVFQNYLASNNWNEQPRGAWRVKSISGNTQGDGVASKTVVVTVHVTEPLGVLSPFLFAKPGAGIAGVQAINFNLTLDSAGSRSWRSTSTVQTVVCTYSHAQLLVNFLSPKASQLVKYSPKNILPYSQLQVYKSNAVAAADGSANSPSIQLSSIPKMALIFVRPTSRTYTTADYVLPITKININFNGRNGLLSGATQQQLYAMSVLSGVNQSWQEWYGSANSGVLAGTPIFTQGGILALTFGRDIECANEYDAPSSIGQYNFAVNVNFDNSCGSAGNVELYIVLVNNGFMASERGQSSTYTSILSKADVMSVLNDAPISDAPTAQVLPDEGSEVLTGGRRRAMMKGMGMSAGGRSAGAKKLHSRLM
jgi:hypothetical protein